MAGAKSYLLPTAGSIDATDIVPHDRGIIRACRAIYDPDRDPKIAGDAKCTVFLGRLSYSTTEDTLRKEFSRYGRVKAVKIIKDIVTGASRGYAFVEYEDQRDAQRAFTSAHRSVIDERQIMVDYERERCMMGWIPRRLGAGLGGRKESGQLRFGGRDRPFKKPIVLLPEQFQQQQQREQQREQHHQQRQQQSWRPASENYGVQSKRPREDAERENRSESGSRSQIDHRHKDHRHS